MYYKRSISRHGELPEGGGGLNHYTPAYIPSLMIPLVPVIPRLFLAVAMAELALLAPEKLLLIRDKFGIRSSSSFVSGSDINF